MNSASVPRRLVVIAALQNNALTLTSIMNTLYFEGQKKSIRNVLILYDEFVEKNTDLEQLRTIIRQMNLEIEEQKIPLINELMHDKINYRPQDGDCIIVPGVQLHLALILDHLCKELESVVGIKTAYVCFTKPEGNLIQWIRVMKGKENKLEVVSREHTLPFKSSIKWYFDSNIRYDEPTLKLSNYKLDNLINSEKKSTDLEQWIADEEVIELTGVLSKNEIGFAFEKLAGACVQRNNSIHQVVMNVYFGSERKKNLAKREEDIIAIHKNGNLIYVSCKFKWCTNQNNCKSEMLTEIDRVRNLQLPFKVPKQRVTRMLITTTKAMNLISSDDEVIVTNLAGLSSIIESL